MHVSALGDPDHDRHGPLVQRGARSYLIGSMDQLQFGLISRLSTTDQQSTSGKYSLSRTSPLIHRATDHFGKGSVSA